MSNEKVIIENVCGDPRAEWRVNGITLKQGQKTPAMERPSNNVIIAELIPSTELSFYSIQESKMTQMLTLCATIPIQGREEPTDNTVTVSLGDSQS